MSEHRNHHQGTHDTKGEREAALRRAFQIGMAVGAEHHDAALHAWRPPATRRAEQAARLAETDAIIEAFQPFIDQALRDAVHELREKVVKYVVEGHAPSPDVEAAYRLGYDAGRRHPDATILPFHSN